MWPNLVLCTLPILVRLMQHEMAVPLAPGMLYLVVQPRKVNLL